MVKWKSSNLWTKIPYENLAHYLTDFVINFFVYLTLMFIFLFMIIGGTDSSQKRIDPGNTAEDCPLSSQ